ncbi:MAG: proton-conducting transporter membrane subunit [Caldisericaceae bacterium]
MNFSLLTLLFTPFVGGVLTYLGGLINKSVRFAFAILFSILTVVIASGYYASKIDSLVYGRIFGSLLVFQMNPISWLLLIVISTIFLMSVLFSVPEMEDLKNVNAYYLELLLLEGSMIGIVLAGDVLTFFVFWEMMSWLSYFLIIKGTEDSKEAGYKYIIMSLIGANSALIGLVLIYLKAQSFVFANISLMLSSQSPAFIISIFVLFAVNFLIKAAVMPLHTWLPDAHSEAPTPVSAILSGVLVKLGVYGLFIFTFIIFGANLFKGIIPSIFGDSIILVILQWMAGLSILFGTFLAILQEDAKRILAYSTIAQVGYVVLGLSLNSTLGIAGGLLQLVNHAIFKALLFFVVGAVMYRTGTKNLSELGGLIKKMPVSFIAMLLGIIALAGIPPLNGFASKWMIYQALLEKKSVLLLTIALIGGTGSFLYVYRLIHSVFLGSLPEKYNDVKEVPVLMQIPMILLALLTIVFGVFPGIPLTVVAKVEQFIGMNPVQFTLTGFPQGTGLSTINIVKISGTLVGAFVFAFVLFMLLPKARKISQYDNYAAGQVVTKDTKYNYSFGFYSFFRDVMNPIFKWSADSIYNSFTRFAKVLGDHLRRVYTGDLETYVSYLVVIMTIIFAVVALGGRIW